MAKSFRPARIALAVASAFPLCALANPAARVEFTAGEVRATGADGSSRVLARGAQVGSGDTIDTGSGRAQMRFTDGALVSLQPQTQFRIDQYAFAGKPAEDRGFFSLIKGGLRTITGLVGKGNRDAYKLTTSVATIGIRGTEYSVAYGNSINVTTGDGAIDVCNGGGCLTVTDGQSAYVADQNTPPVIIEVKTDLPPPPPSNAGMVTPPPVDETFLVSENRGEGGGLDVLNGFTGGLTTGDGFYVFGQYTDQYGGYGGQILLSGASAEFSGSTLVRATQGGADYTAVSVAESHQDGIVGWGRWASAQCLVCNTGPLTDVHYIVGRPSTDLAGLTGMVGNYSLSGHTLPTTSSGITGGAVTGMMIVDFSSYSMLVNMNVNVSTITFGLQGTGSVSAGGAVFGGGFTSCSNCGANWSGDFSGFFAGPAGARAGMLYNFNSDTAKGTVNGAAVFTQTSLTQPSL